MNHWIRRDAAMNSLKTIIVAAALATLSGYAHAETVKPLQGVSIHTETKDAVIYYIADKGACKVVLTATDKAAYAPIRFEQTVEPSKPNLRQLDDANALEFACALEAQALSVNVLEMVAQH